MKIETKFNLGQLVYPIAQRPGEKFVKCETCLGIGEIIINATGKERICPDCYGRRGSTEYQALEWNVCNEYASHIGKVNIELYDDEYKDKNRYAYMISATGIGSGTIWYEENLFASREEAQAECDLRNNESPQMEKPPTTRAGGNRKQIKQKSTPRLRV
jgi:hypothetical protein